MIVATTGLWLPGLAALVLVILVVIAIASTGRSALWSEMKRSVPIDVLRFWSVLKRSASAHWWRVCLLVSGALTVWLAGVAAWGLDVMDPWGEHSDLVWPSFFLALALLLIFPVVWKVVNYWSSPGRVLSLLTFMSFAGLGSYLTWRIIDSAAPKTTTTFGPLTSTVEATTSDSATIIALVAATAVALVIAVGGPDLIRRISKVGSGGVELGVWQDVARIPDMATPPSPIPPLLGTDCGWPDPEPLSAEEDWLYQVGTTLVLHLDREGVTADGLTGDDLRRFTRIVYWVGSTALNQNDRYKALELLKAIEHVRGLNLSELYTIARAYHDVANDEMPDSKNVQSPEQKREYNRQRRDYEDKLLHSERFLQLVLSRDPDHAPSHWYLGYIYDELGQYDRAIKHNRLAISKDRAAFLNIGSWNLAVSFLKSGERRKALGALGEIAAKSCWKMIVVDDELADLQTDPKFISMRIQKLG